MIINYISYLILFNIYLIFIFNQLHILYMMLLYCILISILFNAKIERGAISIVSIIYQLYRVILNSMLVLPMSCLASIRTKKAVGWKNIFSWFSNGCPWSMKTLKIIIRLSSKEMEESAKKHFLLNGFNTIKVSSLK